MNMQDKLIHGPNGKPVGSTVQASPDGKYGGFAASSNIKNQSYITNPR
jgi:hypothetical protein